jgi:hypothetical protein
VTLITRSNGDPHWMAAGENFLLHAERRGREEVIAALLSASHVDRGFIDMTLEVVRGGKTNQSGWLFYQLRRALANHVSHALEYLRSDAAPTRKREVAQAMADGLSWYPNRAEEFLGQFDDAPPEHAGLLLAGCARSEVDPLFLDCVLERWLCQEYRPKGYWTVLRALKQKPERWMSLSGRENLTMCVVQDFERLDGKD